MKKKTLKKRKKNLYQVFVYNAIEIPKRIYDKPMLLSFKQKCQRRPKDMRMIEIPLKSKVNIQFSTAEQIERTETAESIRNIRILLNKLAGENFARVSDTIQNNFVYTKEIIDKLAKMLFNKCVKEPKYIHLYIKLADQLFKKFAPRKSEAGRLTIGSNFRKNFLNLCQEAFENRNNNDFLKEFSTDLTEEEKSFRKKQQMLGSMKLIGELFVHGIITDIIVIQCMDNMQSEKTEDNIEIMANLSLTIGKRLYEYYAFEARVNAKKPKLKMTKLNKELFDSYIDYLISIKQNDKISSRVKFLIQDVIDAKENDWMRVFDKKEIAFRKKESVESPSEEKTPEVTDEKLETSELKKKDLNENNIFGRNLEQYQKTQFSEKLRVFAHLNT